MQDQSGISLPNLFLVGAQKAGTTTLHDYLSLSPDIFMPNIKEPGFFIKHRNPGHFITPNQVVPHSERPFANLDEYAELYRAAAKFSWRGDSTTGYLQSDHARRQIREMVPDARVIICLREPVSRAYSAYNWARKARVEPCETFEEALEREEQRRSEGYWYWFDYTGTSRYADKIRKWQRDFAHVKLVLFDDIRDRPRAVVSDIFDWLGVDRTAAEGIEPEIKNPSGVPRSAFARTLRRLLLPPAGSQSPFTVLARAAARNDAIRRARRGIVGWTERDMVPPPRLAEETRALLRSRFAEEIDELEAMIGTDLSAWRQNEP